MDTKQIVVVLLIVAIALSLSSIVLSLSVDGGFAPIDCKEQVKCVGGNGSGSGQIGLTVLPNNQGGGA